MLIEFSVGNFRSFKSNVTLSMVAAKISAKDKHVDENNTYLADNDLILLTSAAVYGANASGKSNLITAIAFMKNFVLNSSRETQASESINVENFRLSTETSDKPSFFQVVFLMGEKKYRYGFEVDRGKVVTEWLFIAGSRKEIRLFSRDEEGISLARKFKEGKGLQDKTRPNALYISVVSQFNGLISKNVLDWFRNLRIVSGLDDVGYRGFTLDRFEEESFRQDIIRLVKSLDLGIDDITSKKMEQSEVNLPADFPKELKVLIFKNPSNWFLIQTQHKKYDANGKSVDIEVFDLESNESHGTQKLFFLAGPLLDTLVNGRVLFIDELEARLHPNLTCEIIKLFNSKETNKNHSQLIFTTHDTNLLSNKMFRRDQIYFTEKDRRGSTHLYSLSELKVRNDAFYENDYIEGKYGAIPFIGDLRRISLEEEK
jgi:AAA15 family ATPase/GTPase